MDEKKKAAWAVVESKGDELEARWSAKEEWEGLGICGNCNSLYACKNDRGIKFAKCGELNIFLTAKDPVTQCSCYYKKGFMRLYDMKEMATMIEIKNPVGFATEPNVEVLKGEDDDVEEGNGI